MKLIDKSFIKQYRNLCSIMYRIPPLNIYENNQSLLDIYLLYNCSHINHFQIFKDNKNYGLGTCGIAYKDDDGDIYIVGGMGDNTLKRNSLITGYNKSLKDRALNENKY